MNKDWIDIAVLEDYLDGKLDAKAMNRVEREALEDPFVAEALAGLSAAPGRSLESISLLQKQLQERVAAHQHSKKTTVITWQRLSIAATAAVLFVSVGIIFWMKQNNYQDTLAKQAKQPRKVEVTIASRESKDSLIKAHTQVAAVNASKAETLKAEALKSKAIERAITLAKSEAYASNRKARNNEVLTRTDSPPSPAVASETASALNEVTVAAASQLRQKSVAFSTANLTTAGETKTVSGRVVDVKSGAPLPNAGIFASLTPNGPLKGLGTADQDGNYFVTVPANAAQLTFTSAGYETQRVKIVGDTFNVAMRESSVQLNELVIRGYQKRSKDQTTGSSFIVSGKEVQDVPVANVEQLVQGRVAGLNIQNNTGAPGQRGGINIRGLSSISDTSSAQPSNGWDKFKAYLIKTNRFSSRTKPGQTAEFKFVVKNGRPNNIVTVKGVSAEYDEEAIRLIKNGPSWILSNPAHPDVNVVLRF